MNITLIEQPEKKKMDIGCRREFMLKGSYQSLEGVPLSVARVPTQKPGESDMIYNSVSIRKATLLTIISVVANIMEEIFSIKKTISRNV